MSIRNKNAMNDVKTPAQNVSRGGRKHNLAGAGMVTTKGTGRIRPTDARAAQSDGMTLSTYKHPKSLHKFMGSRSHRKV